jgi:hypothetical protein
MGQADGSGERRLWGPGIGPEPAEAGQELGRYTQEEWTRFVQLQPETARLISSGGRFVVYPYCVSMILLSSKRVSGVTYVAPGESASSKGRRYVIASLLLGWWGIPWGPMWTLDAISTCLHGGQDVTGAVIRTAAGAAIR